MNPHVKKIIDEMHDDTTLSTDVLEMLVDALNERSALLWNSTVNLIDPEEAPKISQIAYVEFTTMLEDEIELSVESIVANLADEVRADLDDIIINGDTSSEEEFISFVDGVIKLAPKKVYECDDLQDLTDANSDTYCLVNEERFRKICRDITLPLIVCPIPMTNLFFGNRDSITVTFYDDASLVLNEDNSCTLTLPMQIDVSGNYSKLISV